MIEDKATEKLKKRAQDAGLIVNASAGENESTIESQTKTTRELPEGFKQAADVEMAGEDEGSRK
ncbi:MAG: hypothetical protein H0W76_22380 [Pyrinomonadaceae bacterium]|nr:hypothetical protein [Pyrinomonadaceae bacterium]